MAQRIGPEMFAKDETVADIEQKVLDSVPTATIPIVTGGTTVGHNPKLGKDVFIEIYDALDPECKGNFPISWMSKDVGSFSKKLPLGKPVAVPEVIAKYLESDSIVETTTKYLDPESPLAQNKALAETFNRGMRYGVDSEGNAYLTKRYRRYMVRRVYDVVGA